MASMQTATLTYHDGESDEVEVLEYEPEKYIMFRFADDGSTWEAYWNAEFQLWLDDGEPETSDYGYKIEVR